jgi:N-acetylmuramoyl-L-alanine amidase
LWNLIDLLYDVSYFIFKSADSLKWDALLIYIVYAFGKRSGMKMFRKFMADHFPTFADESEDWRKWATKQIESLGGAKWQPTKLYGRTKRSRKPGAKNSNTSLTLLQPDTHPDAQRSEPNMITVICDAGHGGKPNKQKIKYDVGAVSCTGKYEKDFNLSVALKVAELFKAIPDVKLVLTRNNDEFVELNDRAMIANAVKADLFISIHANSSKFKSSNGTETFYTNDFSKKFADAMHPFILAVTGFKDRKVQKKSLAVTRKTEMPAILLEPGFLSNPEEEAVLMSEDFQNRFAEAIVKGACAFLVVPYGVSTQQPIVNTGMIAISAVIDGQPPFTAYMKDGVSWIPARDILPLITQYWTFKDKRILLNGNPVDTMLIDGRAYIKSRDLMTIGAGVFYEPNFENAKAVLIYPPKQEGAI